MELDAKSLEVDKFETYEDYLDSQISKKDMYYLSDQTLARQLVELGYRGTGEAFKREEFERRKREIEELRRNALSKNTQVYEIEC
eukprot:941599-Amorphochlora_amoeboformis.AAC.2